MSVLNLKKIVLIASSIGVAIFAWSFYFMKTCQHNAPDLCWGRRGLVGDLQESLLVVAPLFLLSLITYKLRDEIFQSWMRFCLWAVPLTAILPIFASERGSMFAPSFKETLVFGLPILFTVVSLGIISKEGSQKRIK